MCASCAGMSAAPLTDAEDETPRELVVAPTAIADGETAGEEILCPVGPAFPAEITMERPALVARATACDSRSSEGSPAARSPPKLILATSAPSRRAASRPARTVEDCPPSGKTL